ncbi:MAG: RecQ family ATP-dependent DNA helicase [Planctomycetaceae bacterium]|nr:MAG: RecQ family ATP-dependent DNA helicase [Planctomycetaceae bacterium]
MAFSMTASPPAPSPGHTPGRSPGPGASPGPRVERLTDDPETLLRRFGLTGFRPGQRDVIDAIAAGHDVLCVMPTGGGKSLCYQLPSLARKGTTIVVSPLIALMKDQVDALHRLGISAKLINSTLSLSEQDDVMRQMANGELDLVYVAPERLRNGRFLEAVGKAGVSLLAIDEAHCVSEWGHDFRPDYARLGQFRRRYLHGIQTIALTATATPHVREDIKAILEMSEPREFVTGFARTNLRFSVEHCGNDREKNERLLQFIRGQSGSGIVYAATRKKCEEVAEWLPEKLRRPIGVYHAGMESAQRRWVQEEFMSGNLAAIVATNAFGMGIDKADIRYVAHYNIPGSLEAYYQEAGRAGRDGRPSECRLFFSYSDRYVQEFFIENRYPSPDVVRKVYNYLLAWPDDPIELTLQQVRDAIGIKETAESVGTAETLLARAGVLKRLDSNSNALIVRIDSDLPTLVDLLPREAKLRRKVMQAVEKYVGSRRGEDIYVNPQRLVDAAGVERESLARTLRELAKLKAFDYVPPFRGRAVHFTQRDVPFDQLKIDFEELGRRKQAEYDKLEAVIDFARTPQCRQRSVLEYFGDPHVRDCGMCDRCDPAGKSMPTEMMTAKQLATVNQDPAERLKGVDQVTLLRGIRIVLSGIKRMHGRFGKAMIAQMLGGSQNKKIQQWKLNRLSTYGMLSGLRQPELVTLIDTLIAAGMAAQVEVEDRRPTVQLTEFGEEVMHARQPLPTSLGLTFPLAKRLARAAAEIEGGDVAGETGQRSESPQEHAISKQDDVSLSGSSVTANHEAGEPLPEATASPKRPLATPDTAQPSGASTASISSPESAADAATESDAADEELINRLKRWRGKTSAALGLPAFRVLSNATITRLATERPTDTEALEAISGVGPVTVEQFGYDLVEMIRQACEPSDDAGPPESTATPDSPHQKTHAEAAAAAASRSSDSGRGIPSSSASPKPAAQKPGAAKRADSVPLPPPQLNPRAAEELASSTRPAEESGDAYWTWRMLRDGYTWHDVATIRRTTPQQMIEDLAAVAALGHPVVPDWAPDADLRQQLASRIG